MNLDDLKRPFRLDEIEFRLGNTNVKKVRRDTGDQNALPTMASALFYMDARAVANRLDEVCGPQNWQNRFSHAGQKTCCEIGIRASGMIDNETGELTYDWVWKSDGAGDTDFEGEKGAFSDAFKRAATKWGIGRYLYDIKTPWVPVENKRFTKEAETILNKAYRDAIWVGPLSITELKDKMRSFVNHLHETVNVDDVDLLVRANKDILDQCEQDEPTWFYGKDDTPSVDERISRKRDELKAREAA